MTTFTSLLQEEFARAKGIYNVPKSFSSPYLSEKAAQLVYTPVYNTVEERTLYDEVNNRFERRAYFVQYMVMGYKSLPTEKEFEHFCEIINKIVESGDVHEGSLGGIVVLRLLVETQKGTNYLLMWSPLGKIGIEEMKEKYPKYFMDEGTLPEPYIS